jgi:uncharacterized protein YbcV (DUF1398 family)
MEINSSLKRTIEELMDDHYSNPGSFDRFLEQMLAIGITRLAFDALTIETHFYTEQEYIYSLKMKDLVHAQAKESWTMGSDFNSPLVLKAIQAYDAQKIDAIQFHKDIFAAGVVYGTVFLKTGKILYLGSDGQSFLEEF